MTAKQLTKDPYNIIITGVGGQGNVMASRVLASMLVNNGYVVTIGETFGASQRGGSVMSHLRVSTRGSWSPQIPKGKADVVVALEPSEAIRVLCDYGNPRVKILSNTRPIHPVGVIAGELDYPSMEETIKSAEDLAAEVWFIDATDQAVKLGNPILGNIIMLGALSALGDLPVSIQDFKNVIQNSMSKDKHDINLTAFGLGEKLIQQ
ncbi:MAG: indolepyruvate oxidoreductase subunit beta [Deltaproteobacteria bacterium]|nr:indolepyruvate oxidoreductase subunit beta [Deltaproteobacteria bacterium]